MISLPKSALEPVGRFFAWWGSELASLVPKRSASVSRRRQLVYSVGTDGPRLFLERGANRTELTQGLDPREREIEIDARLSHDQGLRQLPIVLRLPMAAGLQRTILLPAAAIADAGKIATLDLERATPFRRQDVLAAHGISDGGDAGGKFRLRQIVFKRETVREAGAALSRHGLSPARVECWDEAGGAPLDMNFLAWDRIDIPAKRSFLPQALLVSALALGLLGAVTLIGRFERAETDVRSEAGLQRKRLAELLTSQKEADVEQQRAAQLLLWRSMHSSRAELIEALSRLLPDSDHLTSLQFDGRDVELSGYSASTAQLVPLIERSGVLAGTTLAAPAVFDPRSGKERFTLKARVEVIGRPAEGKLGPKGP